MRSGDRQLNASCDNKVYDARQKEGVCASPCSRLRFPSSPRQEFHMKDIKALCAPHMTDGYADLARIATLARARKTRCKPPTWHDRAVVAPERQGALISSNKRWIRTR